MNDRPERARLETKRKQPKLLLVIMVAFMVAGPGLGPKLLAEEFSHLRWEETETALARGNGTNVVWRACFSRQQEKPYFHPIAFPDGTELTALRPADHPWHLGGWWSWKFINGLNYWEPDPKTGESEGQTEITAARHTLEGDGSARIEMELAYHPRKAAVVLQETRLITVGAPDKTGSYRIDWTSTFTARDQAAILDHPANLRHPTPWYVNQDMPYFSPAMLFNRPHTLAAKTSLTLRYRMFIHSGLLSRAAIDQEWAEFGKR